MAILYKNAKGYPVSTHSYSAGSEFSFCKRKYKLSRIGGWKEKEKRAAMFFGECIESAIQFFHANDMKFQSGKIEFSRLWKKFETNTELVYTDKEGSWADLHEMGHAMMKLYEVMVMRGQLPIKEPKFQLNFKKEVFPGNQELGGINFTSYVDMLSYWLETVEVPEDGLVPRHTAFRKKQLVIDIKTSGVSLPDDPNVLMLDPQLRSYAWVTGIPDVAFLWFVKGSQSVKRGDTVTLLVQAGVSQIGDQVTVLKYDKDEEEIAFVLPATYGAFEKEHSGLKGKASEAVIEKYIDPMQVVGRGEVTKIKLLFKQVTISQEDILEAGQAIGQEIAEIHEAYKQDSFPKEPGIRFPNNKCLMCSMLGICTKNDTLRDETLINIAPKKDDWLDELEKGE